MSLYTWLGCCVHVCECVSLFACSVRGEMYREKRNKNCISLAYRRPVRGRTLASAWRCVV